MTWPVFHRIKEVDVQAYLANFVSFKFTSKSGNAELRLYGTTTELVLNLWGCYVKERCGQNKPLSHSQSSRELVFFCETAKKSLM